jgi:hypothetical protein
MPVCDVESFRMLLPHLAGWCSNGSNGPGKAGASWRGRARGVRGVVGRTRVHGYYERTVADAAIGGQPVALRLQVRRLSCDTVNCACRAFAEQFTEVAEGYARRRLLTPPLNIPPTPKICHPELQGTARRTPRG